MRLVAPTSLVISPPEEHIFGGAPRRFRDASDRARADWASADPARQARQAGCESTADGVLVPFFGRPHLATHPAGIVSAEAAPVHATVAILVLHYLTHADGAPVAGEWLAFRDLPDGLFYSPSFASRAEAPIAAAFGGGFGGTRAPGNELGEFRAAAASVGGDELDLADASFAFLALPRLRLAALLWEGDEDYPAEARILFDAAAGHYLAAEDLAGLGEALARRLISSR